MWRLCGECEVKKCVSTLSPNKKYICDEVHVHKMKQYQRKEIAFERVLFFSDAVVAIAITLLALDLRLQLPGAHQMVFKDLLLPWRNYVAFVLSFINVAAFWRTHHDFFIYIHKMDDRMMVFNICWLFCIVTLPFCTSLVSTHFGDSPAIFLYCLNVFLISIFQNSIWDYADGKEGFLNRENLHPDYNKRIKLIVNLDMVNGAVALIVSFFYPRAAFFLLFFKLPAFLYAAFYMGRKRRDLRRNSQVN